MFSSFIEKSAHPWFETWVTVIPFQMEKEKKWKILFWVYLKESVWEKKSSCPFLARLSKPRQIHRNADTEADKTKNKADLQSPNDFRNLKGDPASSLTPTLASEVRKFRTKKLNDSTNAQIRNERSRKIKKKKLLCWKTCQLMYEIKTWSGLPGFDRIQ